MDFKKVLDQTVRELKREVNKTILKVPEIEQKVLDATSNEPWGPHGTVMADIAQATRNHYEFQMIMVILWKRLSDTGRNWRHVYKALTVLEYLVSHGSERVIDEIREHAYQISTLVDFHYVEVNGKDQGINVRKKSQTLVALVNDKEKISEVRQKAAENRDKYRGVSSTGGMYKPSSYNSTGGSYGGDRYEEDSYGAYGRRDGDRYGRDRDSDRYREEDRYGSRDSDRSGRPGDRYRDDHDNDEDQYGYRRGDDRYSDKSRSYDKDLDRAHDDADHYSSRGAGGRNSDHGEDNKRTVQKPSTAPPSYEEALQSPDHQGLRASNQSTSAGSANNAASANMSDDFDDFNPRASSAPAAAPQLDDLFSHSEPSMAIRTSPSPPGLSSASDIFGDTLSSTVTSAPPPVNSYPLQELAGDLFGDVPFKVEASGALSTAPAPAPAPVQAGIKPPPSYSFPAGNGLQASMNLSSTAFIKPPPSHTTMSSGNGVTQAPAAGGMAFNVFEPTAPSLPSQSSNVPFGGEDFFGVDAFKGMSTPSSVQQPAFSMNTGSTIQPGSLQANQPLPSSFSTAPLLFPSASQGQVVSSNSLKPQEKRFETKSTVWADSLSKGLIDLNIGGPKNNPLADIGIDFDLLRTEQVKEERASSGRSVPTGMGKAMGSGSGLGVAGASAIVPPSGPLMMNNMRMAAPMGMNPMGMGMGMGMGTVPPMMRMGMNPGLAMRPSMGMNTGMGGYQNQHQQQQQQQYGGFR